MYMFLKKFLLLVQAANQGRIVDPNITKYSVKVLPVSLDVCIFCSVRMFFPLFMIIDILKLSTL